MAYPLSSGEAQLFTSFVTSSQKVTSMKSFDLRFKHVFLWASLGSLFALTTTAGCSGTDGSGAPASCGGLDVSSKAQATVKAYGEACGKLNTRAKEVEAKWLSVCNEINAELGEDSTQTDTAKACAVLNHRVKAALDAGVTVSLDVQADCHADVSVQADCEAQCQVDASCDVAAKCEPGKLVVECSGACDAECDVQAPSATCTGTCQGSCTADAAITCMGECSGSCSDPSWEGTCDAGCTAMFSGTCGGTCMGKCDGQDSSAACAGKCEGTCSANASGSCAAKCTGMFKGGCKGSCSGSCAASAGAQCNGKCDGTCTYAPGKADCNGECHGTCMGAVKPPTCTGKLDCQGSADCHASCQGSAQADAACTSTAVLQVEGDAKLYSAINTHLGDLKEAFALTIALKDPIIDLAGRTQATFSALGDIGVQGGACLASSLAVAAEASVSINVSVQASASVQGKAST